MKYARNNIFSLDFLLVNYKCSQMKLERFTEYCNSLFSSIIPRNALFIVTRTVTVCISNGSGNAINSVEYLMR